MSLAGQSSLALAQTAGTFTATGKMTTPRSEHTATLLLDGSVLMTGGSFASAAELYDPSTGKFTVAGSMTTARFQHAATLLPDGRVLITGGSDGHSPLSSAELYDPTSGAFTATGNMINVRIGHTAILLANGKVLLVGGYGNGSDPNLVGAELYDPATGTFSATGAYASIRGCDFCPPAILLADGKVLFTGQNQAQVYNPATGTFSLTGTTVDDSFSAATLLTDGRVLFAGGEGLGRISAADLYDPAAGTFAFTGSMAWRRVWHTLTLLPSGMVLAAGGDTDGCSDNSCAVYGTVTSAELYDPSTGAFATTGDMTASRETHTATLLKDGRVLIAGGMSFGGGGSFSGATASAELYCPVNANCPSDPWQQAIAQMKASAGTNSLNFYQWAWYWQNTPAFAGAPSGFGVAGSISPDRMQQIIAAGGGNPLLNISVEQWVSYFRQVVPQ